MLNYYVELNYSLYLYLYTYIGTYALNADLLHVVDLFKTYMHRDRKSTQNCCVIHLYYPLVYSVMFVEDEIMTKMIDIVCSLLTARPTSPGSIKYTQCNVFAPHSSDAMSRN